jgi:group II intron reverse transcriptase/maturase
LSQISKVSSSDPKYRYTSLANMLDEEYLRECYRDLKKGKVPGIDGQTVEQYGESLEENLQELVSRLKNMQYRAQALRRSYIPKGSNGLRPLGIPAVEDKVVQMGITKILEAIYEPNFTEMSYGFRKGKSQHMALKRIGEVISTKPVNYIIDADIEGFFNNVKHNWLLKFLEHRINDRNLIRIIVRILRSGVMEQGEYYKTTEGTPQGGVISPMLANIYLHYVLDLWMERKVKRQAEGYVEMIRYADDFIICVENKTEAHNIIEMLKERLAKFGLKLSEEKTKLVSFGRNAGKDDEDKTGTFNFLGLTHYCTKSRQGKFKVGRKTSKARYNQKLKQVNEWLRRARNFYKLKEIWRLIRLKLIGHYNYYGVSENYIMIEKYYKTIKKLLFKWLNRRSQKKSYTWKKYLKYLERYPLPMPRITVSFYRKEKL